MELFLYLEFFLLFIEMDLNVYFVLYDYNMCVQSACVSGIDDLSILIIMET